MLDASEVDGWLDGILMGAVRSIFGEPSETPEQQVGEIEEIGIDLTGHNLCGVEVPASS